VPLYFQLSNVKSSENQIERNQKLFTVNVLILAHSNFSATKQNMKDDFFLAWISTSAV